MNKRIFLSALVLTIAGVMLNYPFAAAQKVRIAPCVKANPSYNLPFYAAEERNIWKKNGIDGEWVGIKGGAAMARAMAAAALDIGICGPLGGIRAIARGVPEVIIADYQSPQVWYIFVRGNSPIKGPKDLKGAKIGVSRLGGTAHAYGMVIAKSLGLEKDISWQGAGGTQEQIATLKAGVNDGMIASFYTMVALKFKGEVREAVRIHDYLPKEWMDLAVFARSAFVKEKPDQARGALKGLFDAAGFVRGNADWTVEKLKEHYRFSEEVARQIHKDALVYGKEPKINRKAVENARKFLIDAGILAKEKAPPVDKLYTTKFVR